MVMKSPCLGVSDLRGAQGHLQLFTATLFYKESQIPSENQPQTGAVGLQSATSCVYLKATVRQRSLVQGQDFKDLGLVQAVYHEDKCSSAEVKLLLQAPCPPSTWQFAPDTNLQSCMYIVMLKYQEKTNF